MAPTDILSGPQTEIKLKSGLNQQNNIDFHKTINYVPLKIMCHYDEVDNPNSPNVNPNFELMKHEKNRLDSFEEKWPLSYIKSVDLAEAGFFYLQREDQVQCAFCKLILRDWEENDIPLQEHKKNFPRCPFLTQKALENKPPKTEPSSSYCSVYVPPSQSSSLIKPKYPAMADIRKRLLTFEKWSHPFITAKALADCGFFYTGTSDYVTCFFCGKSEGFWKPSDIPLNEHMRLYPDCPYLRLLKNRPPQKIVTTLNKKPDLPKPKHNLTEALKQELLTELLDSEIVKEAREIFPFSVIEEAVLQRVTKSGKPFSSLYELATDILNIEQEKIKQGSTCEYQKGDKCGSIHEESTNNGTNLEFPKSKGGANLNNTSLCKICMDSDRNVTFQPCGHFVACSQCADQISECPICRRTIEDKIKTYLS